MKNDTVSFLSEDGENIKLSVLEETKINGISYILVTDSFEGEDGECYIMKDISNGDSEDANYIFVEDENELDSVFEIFEKMMDDIDIVR
ncbi:DUF1292 domain-containing protein [Lachnoanaerobaculum saburreum]|jgi:hypothetical protein|uniref:DUF1292 domain-containing protein n=1 Tax=Lachnoanaerobaculum saburreum TaxID=467210 RepID=A0A133ZBR3_9FIRM|nr:DUF1292 domain-containing protein [Lachnoanaerobaculum saburreum]KXB52867.1 hypothetical protein HMPREF1866_02785 [Lachnoanaerobaculum saburreum]